jgi:hypothetical protein
MSKPFRNLAGESQETLLDPLSIPLNPALTRSRTMSDDVTDKRTMLKLTTDGKLVEVKVNPLSQ